MQNLLEYRLLSKPTKYDHQLTQNQVLNKLIKQIDKKLQIIFSGYDNRKEKNLVRKCYADDHENDDVDTTTVSMLSMLKLSFDSKGYGVKNLHVLRSLDFVCVTSLMYHYLNSF